MENMARSGFEGSKIEPTRLNSAQNGTLDFYMSRTALKNKIIDPNQSVLSQKLSEELEFLNGNMG